MSDKNKKNFLRNLPNYAVILILVAVLIAGTFTGITVTRYIVYQHARKAFTHFMMPGPEGHEKNSKRFEQIMEKRKNKFIAAFARKLKLTEEQKQKVQKILDNRKKEMEAIRLKTQAAFKKVRDEIYSLLNDEQKKKFNKKMKRFGHFPPPPFHD